MTNIEIQEYRRNIGNNLNYYRRKAGLTQKQVADILLIERSTYSRYETGSSSPSLDTLIKLSSIFNISTDKLFIGFDNDEKSSEGLTDSE